jgi:hypothetical protein
MIGITELWNSWKENKKIILKVQKENKSIEKKILTFFTDAWEKKYGDPLIETCLKMSSYDPSNRFIYDREIEKGEDAVEIFFIDSRDQDIYDSTVIPIKAFFEEELDPKYLATREDTKRLKEEEYRLKEEREEYERLKEKYERKRIVTI